MKMPDPAYGKECIPPFVRKLLSCRMGAEHARAICKNTCTRAEWCQRNPFDCRAWPDGYGDAPVLLKQPAESSSAGLTVVGLLAAIVLVAAWWAMSTGILS